MNIVLKKENQCHLKYEDKINLGSFYTPKRYVNIVWKKIIPYLTSNSIVLDSSCGYGNFFDFHFKCRKIANDIDSVAVYQVKRNFCDIEIFNKNALKNVNREMFKISDDEKLIVIGNPPYNDRSSIIRNRIKKDNIEIDEDIKSRDLGISFLLSYSKLNADIICVLHPLSYLIKKANFNLLKNFTKKYRLIDSVIIDSKTFKETSKGISFPIVIALYKKDEAGMDYEYIKNYEFKTIDNRKFSLKNFDFISNYIRKYPLKNQIPKRDDILFWTMRDINALKRNRTFVENFGYNTIIVDKSKLDYYIYVDVFKQFSHRIPYYFGNLDVFIDNNLFLQNKKYFYREVIERHPFLKRYIAYDKNISIQEARKNIINYFKNLLGEHFAY